MTFEVAHTGGNCSFCRWIAAEGRITSATPERFERFLDEDTPGVNTIRLHSDGGNPEAAVKLGRMLRARDMKVIVGHTGTATKYDVATPKPGRCFSACAYAFLGGSTREIPEGSRIGFHRFKANSEATKRALETFEERLGISVEQVFTGVLAVYVEEMGADPEILYKAAATPSGGMYVPSRSELERYGIVTERPSWSRWDLVHTRGHLVYQTRLDRESPAMASLLCDDGDFLFNIMTNSIAQDATTLSRVAEPHLSVGDNGRYLGDDHLVIDVEGTKTQFTIQLTPTEIDRIADGKRVTFKAGTPQYIGSLLRDFAPPALPETEARSMIDLMRRSCQD